MKFMNEGKVNFDNNLNILVSNIKRLYFSQDKKHCSECNWQ